MEVNFSMSRDRIRKIESLPKLHMQKVTEYIVTKPCFNMRVKGHEDKAIFTELQNIWNEGRTNDLKEQADKLEKNLKDENPSKE
jgi:hypothetical protein